MYVLIGHVYCHTTYAHIRTHTQNYIDASTKLHTHARYVHVHIYILTFSLIHIYKRTTEAEREREREIHMYASTFVCKKYILAYIRNIQPPFVRARVYSKKKKMMMITTSRWAIQFDSNE